MGDHLATTDMGQKVEGCCAPLLGIGEGKKLKQLHCRAQAQTWNCTSLPP